MRAALLVRPGQIVVEDIPEPEVGTGGGAHRCRRCGPVRVGPQRVQRHVGRTVLSLGHGSRGVRIDRGRRSRGGSGSRRPDGGGRAEHRLSHLRSVPSWPDVRMRGTAVRRDEPSGRARRAPRRPGAIRVADPWRCAGRPRLRRADDGSDGRAAPSRHGPTCVGPRGRGRCPGPADVACPPRSERRRPRS